MALIDATRWFKDPAMDWSLRGQAFVRQFEGRVDSMRGVYAHLDMNASDLPIYDKNGPGKLLVLGSTMAIKFGKYVGGLSGRMLQNHDHLHRRRADGSLEDGIFANVLTCLLVLDLSQRRHEEIRPLETMWNRAIRAELRTRGLVHREHRGRAETVNLARAISSDELLGIVEPIARRVEGTA
jgi:hypothetical protein